MGARADKPAPTFDCRVTFAETLIELAQAMSGSSLSATTASVRAISEVFKSFFPTASSM
jgi:hypothetical protein